MCYLNSVSFIELLRSFCIHGEACAKILCSEKELLNLKDSKLTQNFYGNKTGLSDRVTYVYNRELSLLEYGCTNMTTWRQ